MKQKLIASIRKRLADEIAVQNPVKFLKEMNPETLVETAISVIYLFTRSPRGAKKKTVYATEIVSAIGHGVRRKFKLKTDSALAAKAGAFVLYSFEEHGLLKVKLGQGQNGHGTYIIDVLDDKMISSLFQEVKLGAVEKLPSLVPHKDWLTCYHETGAKLLKTNYLKVLEITKESHPIVFETVNRSQKVGWNVNQDVLSIYDWALKEHTEAFSDIWGLQNPEALQSKLRETKTIGDMAKRFVDKTFYHLYYLDFRGRKYPATAYLHEQGSDLAKGLLLRADRKSIGERGFFWLLVHIANKWAGDAGRPDGAKTDKVPLNERYKWAHENQNLLLSYARDPKKNNGWMKADKPWCFIAGCIELNKLRRWQSSRTAIRGHDCSSDYSYESGFEAYIDGSNNGSQHLCALTKDEITAPYANLIESAMPGDLYKYIADFVWERLTILNSGLGKLQLEECEQFIDTLIARKKEFYSVPNGHNEKKRLSDAMHNFRKLNDRLLQQSAIVFWNRITDPKHKRKIVKRNVMTLPYGGTPYGLGEQQIDDARKHGVDLLVFMENRWGSFMGRLVFDICKTALKKPMRLLSIFEDAGKRAEERGEFLKWTVPITNFPVVQNYTEGIVKKIYVQYGPAVGERNSTGYFANTLQLHVCFIETVKPTKGKQARGASPNAIHSLDAGHLMLTVHNSENPITTVHDSFGALLADMDDLFMNVRKSFVEFYDTDPLKSLMHDIDGDISNVEIGSLDVKSIIKSEYAFC